jgi:hypothetical protein
MPMKTAITRTIIRYDLLRWSFAIAVMAILVNHFSSLS